MYNIFHGVDCGGLLVPHDVNLKSDMEIPPNPAATRGETLEGKTRLGFL